MVITMEALTVDEAKAIALEEGLRSAILLDKLRLQMLHEAVDWICEMTGLNVVDVRKQIANGCGVAVKRNLDTINAAKTVIREAVK